MKQTLTLIALLMLVMSIDAQKKQKCYTRQFKHVSKIDTTEFNAMSSFNEQMDYMTRWKEKCRGFTMAFKGGTTNFETLNAYSVALGYRGHHFREELEFNHSETIVDGDTYYAKNALAGLYLDIHKHTPTPFKPYIGANLGVVFFDDEAFNFDKGGFSSAEFTYGFTAGFNLRMFPGFYIFAEYRKMFANMKDELSNQEYDANTTSVNSGIRLNF